MLRAAAKIVAASGAKAFSATWAAISHDDLETRAMHEPGFVVVLVLVLRADAPTATGDHRFLVGAHQQHLFEQCGFVDRLGFWVHCDSRFDSGDGSLGRPGEAARCSARRFGD